MTVEEVREHLAYSAWASRRVLSAVWALEPDERRREAGAAHKSMLGTLEHIFMGDRFWCALGVDPGLLGPGGEEPHPGDALEAEWERVHKAWANWAASANEEELARVVEFKIRGGSLRSAPMWRIVMHVVNHATFHRGQVMLMLRHRGIAPLPADLMDYYLGLKDE